MIYGGLAPRLVCFWWWCAVVLPPLWMLVAAGEGVGFNLPKSHFQAGLCLRDV